MVRQWQGCATAWRTTDDLLAEFGLGERERELTFPECNSGKQPPR